MDRAIEELEKTLKDCLRLVDEYYISRLDLSPSIRFDPSERSQFLRDLLEAKRPIIDCLAKLRILSSPRPVFGDWGRFERP